MTTEEMKLALQAELSDFKKNLPKYVSPDDLEKQLSDIETRMDKLDIKDDLSELKTAVEEQGIELRKIAEKGETKVKTLPEILLEYKDKMTALAERKGGGFTFIIPKTEITTSSVTSPYQGMQIPGAGQMPHQAAVLRPLFQQVTLAPGSNGTVYYTDQTTDTNNAAGTSESATFKESVAAWTGRSIVVDKITDSFPVTYEALRDQSFIAGEINRLLTTHLRVKEDNYLWDGTGAAPISEGVYTYASAFNSGTYSGFKPASATLYDLLAVMRVEISNSYGGMYQPNYAVMNPADILKMKLAKDANGNYVIPPFALNNGQVVDAMGVIESESVTANTLIVGDFNFGTIYDDGGIEIEVGTTGTNFVEDVVTIKARKRMMLLVRTAYTGAFLKSTDIDSDISGISEVTA